MHEIYEHSRASVCKGLKKTQNHFINWPFNEYKYKNTKLWKPFLKPVMLQMKQFLEYNELDSVVLPFGIEKGWKSKLGFAGLFTSVGWRRDRPLRCGSRGPQQQHGNFAKDIQKKDFFQIFETLSKKGQARSSEEYECRFFCSWKNRNRFKIHVFMPSACILFQQPHTLAIRNQSNT